MAPRSTSPQPLQTDPGGSRMMPLSKFPLVAVAAMTCQPDISSEDLAGSLFPIPAAPNLPAGISAPAPRCVRAPRLRFILPSDRGTLSRSRRPIRHRLCDILPSSAAARQYLVCASRVSVMRSCVPVDASKMGHLPRLIHEKSLSKFSLA